MSIIIRLQHLPWSASAADIREFFHGLIIPEGGVHIVGGRDGDVFIQFSSDEDARLAMRQDGKRLKDSKIKLLLSSQKEMQKVIEKARSDYAAGLVAPAFDGTATHASRMSDDEDEYDRPAKRNGGRRSRSRSKERSSYDYQSTPVQYDISQSAEAAKRVGAPPIPGYTACTPVQSQYTTGTFGSSMQDAQLVQPTQQSSFLAALQMHQQQLQQMAQSSVPPSNLIGFQQHVTSQQMFPTQQQMAVHQQMAAGQQQQQPLVAQPAPAPFTTSQIVHQQQQPQFSAMQAPAPQPTNTLSFPVHGMNQMNVPPFPVHQKPPIDGSFYKAEIKSSEPTARLSDQDARFMPPPPPAQFGPAGGPFSVDNYGSQQHLAAAKPMDHHHHQQQQPPMMPHSQFAHHHAVAQQPIPAAGVEPQPKFTGPGSFMGYDQMKQISQQFSHPHPSLPPGLQKLDASDRGMSANINAIDRRARGSLLPAPQANQDQSYYHQTDSKGPVSVQHTPPVKSHVSSMYGPPPSQISHNNNMPGMAAGATSYHGTQAAVSNLHHPLALPHQTNLMGGGGHQNVNAGSAQGFGARQNKQPPPSAPYTAEKAPVMRQEAFVDAGGVVKRTKTPDKTEQYERNATICVEQVPKDMLRYGQIRDFFTPLRLEGPNSIKLIGNHQQDSPYGRVYCRFVTRQEAELSVRLECRNPGIRIKLCSDTEFDSVHDSGPSLERQRVQQTAGFKVDSQARNAEPTMHVKSPHQQYDQKSSNAVSPWSSKPSYQQQDQKSSSNTSANSGKYVVELCNIGYKVTDDALFSFASVVKHKRIHRMMKFKKGIKVTSDTAFIEFNTEEDMQEAIKYLHDRSLEGRNVRAKSCLYALLASSETKLCEPSREIPDYTRGAVRDRSSGVGAVGSPDRSRRSSRSRSRERYRRERSPRDREKDRSDRDKKSSRTSDRNDRDRKRPREKSRSPSRSHTSQTADDRKRRVDPSPTAVTATPTSTTTVTTSATATTTPSSESKQSTPVVQLSSIPIPPSKPQTPIAVTAAQISSPKDKDFRYEPPKPQSQQPVVTKNEPKPPEVKTTNLAEGAATLPKSSANTCIYVTGLAPNATIQAIADFFQTFKPLPGGIRLGQRGTAYVEFEHQRECELATKVKNRQYIGFQVVTLKTCSKQDMMDAVQKQHNLAPSVTTSTAAPQASLVASSPLIQQPPKQSVTTTPVAPIQHTQQHQPSTPARNGPSLLGAGSRSASMGLLGHQPLLQRPSPTQQPNWADQKYNSKTNGPSPIKVSNIGGSSTSRDTNPPPGGAAKVPATAAVTSNGAVGLPLIDPAIVAALGAPGSVCFLHNLPPRITLEEICSLFPPDARLVEDSVRMHYSHQTGEPTGDCLLAFHSSVDADKACRSINGRLISGRTVQMWVVPSA